MTPTLVELLRHVETGIGPRPFVAGRAGTLDGVGFVRRARSLAAGLRSLGVESGDRAAAFVEHDVDLAVFPFACAWIGAVSVLVNPRLHDAQVRHVLDDSGARVVFTSLGRAAGLSDPVAAFGDRTAAVDAPDPPAWAVRLPIDLAPGEAAPVAPAHTATLLYTSGSTGRPKGIVQSHRSLVDGARIVAGYLGLGRADHVLAVLPLSFDYGLNQVLSAAFVGCRVTLLQYLFAGEVVRAIRDLECTGLAGVPEIWVDVVAALRKTGAGELRTLRYVTNSGGALPESVIRFFHDAMPWVDVFAMYGLTEAFRSSFVPPSELRAGRRGIGRAMPEVELLVVDPSAGAVCPEGAVGELVHCGACVADGYWQRADETAARFRTHPVRRSAAGKCVFSGDLARMAADGFVELVGRADAQLKIGGYRVSPDEVVEVVCQVDGVRRAAAVGVPRGPDQIPSLCVLVEAGADRGELAGRVTAACRRALPPWMVPAEVRVSALLPRNQNHKVDLAAVRAVFEEEPA